MLNHWHKLIYVRACYTEKYKSVIEISLPNPILPTKWLVEMLFKKIQNIIRIRVIFVLLRSKHGLTKPYTKLITSMVIYIRSIRTIFANGNPSSKNVSFTLIYKVQSCLFECYKCFNVANVVDCVQWIATNFIYYIFPFSISMPHSNSRIVDRGTKYYTKMHIQNLLMFL